MRRKVIIVFQAACLFLAALSIFVGFRHFAGYPSLDTSRLSFLLEHTTGEHAGNCINCVLTRVYEAAEKPAECPLPELSPTLKNGNSTLLEVAPAYIKAIMTPQDISFPRLDCPAPTGDRYKYLQSNSTTMRVTDAQPKYFFALDLHQCASLLPRLVGSIVETMHFLGPEHCVLSIVEGRSDDGTFEILNVEITDI
jgi:alpha-1,3-mannosyltransferase